MRLEVRTTYRAAFHIVLDYLLDRGAVVAADRLIDEALFTLPERLIQVPRIGRDFLARNPLTPEAQMAWEKARELVGDDIELRECILGDYLALYAIHAEVVHLLTLRHHRQSGYEFSETPQT